MALMMAPKAPHGKRRTVPASTQPRLQPNGQPGWILAASGTLGEHFTLPPVCPGFDFTISDITVVTNLLEAGEPEHVIEAVTGHLSRQMLEHYSHQRLKAKGQMLARMEVRRKKGTA